MEEGFASEEVPYSQSLEDDLLIVLQFSFAHDLLVPIQKLFLLVLRILRVVELRMDRKRFLLLRLWLRLLYVKILWFLLNVQVFHISTGPIEQHHVKIPFSHKVKLPHFLTLTNEHCSVRQHMLCQSGQ